MPEPDIFHVRVAGTSFYQDHIEKLQDGHRCTLVLEPANPHDRNAIQVVAESVGVIGYIPRDKNETLVPVLKEQWEVDVAVDGLGRPVPNAPIGVAIRLEVHCPD